MIQSVVMRKATPGNTGALLEICRGSFPESLLWNGPRFYGRRWWSSAIESKSAEVWVCVSEGKVAGFCVLHTDVAGWKAERRQRDLCLCTKLIISVLCPKVLLWRLRNRMFHDDTAVSNSIMNGNERANGGNAIWVALIAVSPKMRGQGLAKEMLRFCEERTVHLHREAIKLVVMPNNKAAIGLYNRHGFVLADKSSSGLIYSKVVGERSQ